ncbi:capsular biosynthesis protein [Meridianimarinicoccus roseus]|uniref:Capsular biosynthesis protein n=1 Tax=Meridianimarinicoccus roseus TaxID=2072018 RepID=A0A2V2L7Y7_9RHOB|nr:capsular biosynthesis protein [Meridianimarinicoccus roseus]PWR01432.1 capsular biosynthesis protein [Meridianimarinicoccus roseus]
MSAGPGHYIVLRYGRADPDALLDGVASLGGPVSHMSATSLRLAGYPETTDRAAACLATARRQPRSGLHRALKRRLYAVQYNAFRHRFESDARSVAVAWNGITGTRAAFMAAARDAGRPCLYLERAPLPGRITVDSVGVNQSGSLPREADFYRDWAAGAPDRASSGWRAMAPQLVARAPKRGDVTQGAAQADLAGRPFVFCPLQVPDDTQITQFAGWPGTLQGFLDALDTAAASLPDGWHLRLKEHPSSKIPLTGALTRIAARHGDRVVIDNATDTFAQVAAARAVVTLNSSVGLQAFFFDKPVIVLGLAFFRIDGLVTPADSTDHLATIFARIGEEGFDPALRDAFMTYLDRVYYPRIETGPDGAVRVVPDLVLPKLPYPPST